jgi:probable DNA repair protein
LDLEASDLEASLSPQDPACAAAIIVASRLAAEQWELHLAAPLLARKAAAWPAPPVLTYGAWLERLWSANRRADSAALLRPSQSAALWREVIGASPEGPTLIGTAGVAAWAEDAHRKIAAWGIARERLSTRDADGDFAAFLRWRRRYLERLEGEDWIDGAGLEAALAGRMPALAGATGFAPRTAGAVRLAPPLEATPAARRLFDVLAAAGIRIEPQSHPAAPARAVRVQASDSSAEIAAAAGWAARRLEQSPTGRFAVVVPRLRDRAPEVRRVFAAVCGEGAAESVCLASGNAAQEMRPLIGAALNALELLSPRGTFVELSRWLRGPWFFAADTGDRDRAARLEAELRGELLAQIPFVHAYRRAGLRGRIEAHLPAHAARLDAALREIGSDVPRAPSEWMRIWQRTLNRLGGPSDASFEGEDLLVWNRALDELAALTPIVGRLSLGRALAELDAVLARPGRSRRLPIMGIHVLGDMADIGPGYDGAWIAGLTDAALPRPVSLNPLLPRALQVEHAMPWSSPGDALARSRRQLAELLRFVPDVVLSWPARERDNPTQPSPLIRSFPAASDPDDARHEARLAGNGKIQPKELLPPVSHGNGRETLPDPVPAAPPGRLRGGTRALDTAARCPLRAFLEFRLGAKPIEPLERGVPPRIKGIALHHALELLYRRHADRAALDALSEHERAEAASRCAEVALDDVFASARGPLRALYVLELQRVESLLTALLKRELERAPFAVAALERSQAVELGSWRVSTRVDRIDVLEDGSLAIIDYKTGRAGSPADWFAERPRNSQLPLYAVAASAPPRDVAPAGFVLAGSAPEDSTPRDSARTHSAQACAHLSAQVSAHVSANVSALVIAAAGTEGPSYAGVWERAEDFPGRSARLPGGRTLAAQIEAWRAGIGQLLSEHASGDGRIFVADIELAEGAFAPLTRIYEQLALRAGRLEPWPRP